MAKIVLGLGSSHAPQLRLPPNEWYKRVNADHINPELWYRGKTYTFPELVEERGANTFAKELNDETWQRKFDSCQRAISRLGETLDRFSPDVCVMLGDDQHESFYDDNMPAISIYWGDTIDDAPEEMSERQAAFGTAGGYTLTKSEQDPRDAELDWSGHNTTGEVKMDWPCKGRTELTITIRPA